MPAPPRLGRVPDPGELKEELTLICRKPRGWWIAEKAHVLMGLDCVRCHVLKGAPQNEDSYADAVRAYLELSVPKVPSPQHRALLIVVLGLGEERWRDPDWRSKPLGERQEEAGRHMRRPDNMRKPDNLKGSTVRAYQPKAIEDLIAIIINDETKTLRDHNRRKR